MGRMTNNRRGQFVIEAILLMVVLFGLFSVISKTIRDNEIASKMITGPWAKIAGMTESGVWAEANRETRRLHPNNFERFYTPKEE